MYTSQVIEPLQYLTYYIIPIWRNHHTQKQKLKTCDIPGQCYSNTELLTEAQRETKLNVPQSWIAVLGTFLPPPADSERRRPRSCDMKVLTWENQNQEVKHVCCKWLQIPLQVEVRPNQGGCWLTDTGQWCSCGCRQVVEQLQAWAGRIPEPWVAARHGSNGFGHHVAHITFNTEWFTRGFLHLILFCHKEML